MNLLDLLILLVLAAGLARGFSTGLVRQVASIAGLILAFILAVQFMRTVGAAATDSLGLGDGVAPLLGFILVFLAVHVAVFALVRFVETLVGALRLTVLNRMLGGVAGAFKAALALSVCFLILGYLGLPGPEMQTTSVLYEPVSSVLPDAWNYVSEKLPQVEKLSDQFGARLYSSLSAP